MPSTTVNPPERDDGAPWLRIPDKAVISVEHPCIVENIDKAIDMLGGPTAIPEILEEGTDRSMSLNFHPEDAACRPVLSLNSNTNNILLKITIPKRTGRKRKRGSDDPFTHSDDVPLSRRDANYLIRSLSDNQSTYDAEAIAVIPSTHVWRSMPDFVYSTATSPFLNNFRSKILSMSYPRVKEYSMTLTPGPSTTSSEVIPPPIFSTYTAPYNYAYRQNPAVKLYTDPLTGSKRLLNTQAAMRVLTWQMQHDSPTYPTSIASSAPPLATQPHNFQGLVYILAQLFSQRPIWTKRALLNQLPDRAPIFLTRYAIAYVAFAIRSGPWRDTYCKFGVDPRTSPIYRKYQTILLQLVPSKGTRPGPNSTISTKLPTNPSTLTTNPSAPNSSDYSIAYARTWSRSPDRQSHVFTGQTPIPPDGKSWQLLDLHDPLLLPLINIPDIHLRSVCETRYFGWYPNGTQSKIRILLKTKVDAMMAGKALADLGLTDEKVQRFVDLPESWIPGEGAVGRDGRRLDPTSAYLNRAGVTRRELVWASAYRSFCRAREGEVPLSGGNGGGRLSKSKGGVRASFMGKEGQVDGEGGSERPLGGGPGTSGVGEQEEQEELEAEVEDEDESALEAFVEPDLEGDEGEGEGEGEGGDLDMAIDGAENDADIASGVDDEMDGGSLDGDRRIQKDRPARIQ